MSALQCLEFSDRLAAFEMRTNLRIGNLSHAATQRIANEQTFVHHGLALEVPVAGEGQRFPNSLLGSVSRDVLFRFLYSNVRRTNNRLGLMAELRRQFPVSSHDFGSRMNLFTVSRRVGRDLGGFLALLAHALQVLPNLLAARAGSVEILLRVPGLSPLFE